MDRYPLDRVKVPDNFLPEYPDAEAICGKPQPLSFDDKIVAAIKWVDGTVLDTVWRVG